jgi:hypothetical protein
MKSYSRLFLVIFADYQETRQRMAENKSKYRKNLSVAGWSKNGFQGQEGQAIPEMTEHIESIERYIN